MVLDPAIPDTPYYYGGFRDSTLILVKSIMEAHVFKADVDKDKTVESIRECFPKDDNGGTLIVTLFECPDLTVENLLSRFVI